MDETPLAKKHPSTKPQQNNWAATHQRHDLLCWYWALAWRRHSKRLRAAYIQPFVGALIAISGILLGVLVDILHVWFIPIIVAPVMVVIGAIIAILSYPLSVYYSFEYPGGFDERLEEYVARRVSRLSPDAFIPQYQTRDNAANRKIRELNHQVGLALKAEKRRLEQSDRTGLTPVHGVLVVGPRGANKTGALWNAMAHELKGWTFVKWPHHMDHPANLARRLGHRTVLWIDDLHEFARPGEAAALAQFIEELRATRQQFLVLASCKDGRDTQELQEARRYFSPLIAGLQRVSASATPPPTQQLDELKRAYKDDLSEVQRGILRTMDWLQSMRVSTFPGEVLDVLNKYFLNAEANADHNLTWDEAIQGLGNHPAGFVRVDHRAEPQTRLSTERYDFGRWFRHNFFRSSFEKAEHPHKVVEPLNVRYLNLEEFDQEGTRAERARKITSTLEQQPQAIIELLAGYSVAAETLILLGDAYMNHLGESIDNAGELAIACYAAALRIFETGTSPGTYPGVWAAALIGKGTAELHVDDAQKADDAFKQVTQHPAPKNDARPIPPLLMARAWHGRGDVIAAKIPSDEVTSQLQDAADYYEKATSLLPASDPLSAEARLDHANILFEIAHGAFKGYEQSLFGMAAQPPLDKIGAAQKAYEDVRQNYSQTVAPAVWAEIQRRQGELGWMKATYLLPATMQLRLSSANSGIAAVNPLADEAKALETAKLARDYFIAARNVFAPSYLSASWAQTHMGLVRALLIIARIIAQTNKQQARKIYSTCIDTTNATVQKVYPLAESPLDWVDLQLLQARAVIGLGALGEGDAPGQYQQAKTLLNEVDALLAAYKRLPENPTSEHITMQMNTLESLGQQIV